MKIGNGTVSFQIGAETQAGLAEMAKKTGGFLAFTITRPHVPRSTGDRSQNHRINGHIAVIAEAQARDFTEVKLEMKNLAISRGYPFDTEIMRSGSAIIEIMTPWSETIIDKSAGAILCETINQYAAENGIKLPEVTE